ncbi:hypothetical protein [Acidisphaera sp. S103]|uniref:hypothetical protein n=1 Tax=Acidisphaera sp. S103 TaxID=1747223 RepID=UPI00131A7B60|nr:hypothetical protein [Acidisphaera sp. S103]
MGLSGSQNLFAGTRTCHSIAHLPLPQRVAAMRDPEVRANIATEDPNEFNAWSLLCVVDPPGSCHVRCSY